ncbi:MAG TPA: hypothetical protein VFI33_08810 [Puia sp.]|nr:hypothetical protein [Puia sp.]
MAQGYSENQIRSLYSEFKSLKKYVEKLAFFDRWFGIIPFEFPDFDPHLRFFFAREKTEELVDIFKKERNNPGLTLKKFQFDETFAFNIKPANSNSSVYSHFILSCFLARKPTFAEWIKQNISIDKTIEDLLDEANTVMNTIEMYLQNEYDKSFKQQCMSVFYRGFYDAFTSHLSGPGKKRKFIELYLYAQGMIYADFISSLKTAMRKAGQPEDIKTQAPLDLAGKMNLLNELGILDFLTKMYSNSGSGLSSNDLAETISRITGESPEQKEMILHLIKKMSHNNITTSFHRSMAAD